jgi:glucokinase
MGIAQILAGDIGGTKTNLALYRIAGAERTLVREQAFPSRDYASLQAVAQAFLEGERIDAAAFGIAGPVVDNAVRTTNLPWHVVPVEMAQVLGCHRIRLLNDLGATALGALHLPADRFQTLQQGTPRPGNIAVIAAGTGLGQAFLYWDGQRHHPSATEGGHADFAPSTAADVGLLEFAQGLYGHVSWERFVSGPGLHLLFRYLTEKQRRLIDATVRERLEAGEDPGAVIGHAGLDGTCETCRDAVDWFVRLYGAQAGNFALSVLATGGVFLGGGIVTRLLARIDGETFLGAFSAKGRYHDLLRDVPIQAILEPKTALYGAVEAAVELLDQHGTQRAD